ncbi:hypothetical protein KL942_002806 [Ogataea angusta]|uniref:Uncharacterized protein n=1 Tax=Pichia angusta TaxID=870730 RepID=A0ABQ7RSW5_PICAN|nr:hypothetical protein KL920_002887 [Ogataea angusta]KAG7840007.1 hypothetical protein KL942_002806 [Ogataea angusta]KAG7846666.1 hypothetical protein KL940_004264 [Ogataea angusta]KAG7859020.1 hypothetical protein KL919_003085 [Ogataea angusta]
MIRRDRTKVKPYDKIEPKTSGSQGLMGRLRRIFSRSPQPSGENNVADVSNVSNVSNLSVLSDANPNRTLSEFFKSKGDAPLNDIEVEGVLSLINKVHQQNQSQLETFRHSQNESQFLSSSGLKPNDSSFFSNPTVLRPASVKPTAKDVPTYTPREDKIIRHPQPFPTTLKKRVVQYSSLPSPYRMRLETPVKPRVEKREIKSRTANKVLSILENPDVLEEKEDKSLDEQKSPVAKVKPNSSTPEPQPLPKETTVPKEEPEIIEIDSEDDMPEQKSEPKPEPLKPELPVQTVQPQKPKENKPAASPPSTSLPLFAASKGAEPVEQNKAKIEELPQDTPIEPAVVSKPEVVPEEIQKPKFTFRPVEAKPFVPNVPSKPSSLEIIEKFTFPEVETPSSPETPFLPLPQPAVIDHFSFPDVETLDPETLNSINPEAVKLYSSVFTF